MKKKYSLSGIPLNTDHKESNMKIGIAMKIIEDFYKKLDRIGEFLLVHDDDSMKLIGELDCKLDRIEKIQSKMRDNIFTIRKRTDDIEKLLEKGVLVEPLEEAVLFYKKEEMKE